jgi:hypothetical protein
LLKPSVASPKQIGKCDRYQYSDRQRDSTSKILAYPTCDCNVAAIAVTD